MSRTRVIVPSLLVVALATVAAAWVAAPAQAGKPLPVVAATATPNGDCSVDVQIELNSKGQLPSIVVVHYWQQGTQNGDSYQYFGSIERGGILSGNVAFSATDPSFGTTYEVGYTAFAKNGRVLGAPTIDTVNVSACL